MNRSESSLGRAYRWCYDLVCGRHPQIRMWHFQWLGMVYLCRRHRVLLQTLGGRVLDVGCGSKPYRRWFAHCDIYTGIDVYKGPDVDVVIAADQPWPLPDDGFDVVISSQVLEHVQDMERTITEIARTLKPGGTAILTFPFLYNEHGSPGDYRRFTIHGARSLFPQFRVVHLEPLGGIGSTLGILLLNWVEATMNRHFATRLLKAALLPIWLIFALVVNLASIFLDQIDKTSAFYNNVLLVVTKPMP